MKKIPFAEESIASLAVEDASNFGIKNAKIVKEDDKVFVQYESLASFGEKEESCCDPVAICNCLRNDMNYELKWLREDMNYWRDRFTQHLAGHLPPIKDVSLMTKAIKNLGLEDSFQVEKTRVYVEY